MLDRLAAAVLLPLVIWILINGADDLLIDLAWLYRALFRRANNRTPADEAAAMPERRMAIFVPLWREHRVISRMIEHNIASQKYGAYDFFLGAYPNDAPTLAAIEALEQRFPNVHLARCPHDGPTSKADCLNWIYQRMLVYEEEHGARFEMILTHDAEDLIHPEALRWINYYAQWNDMVQVPVLALPTPWRELTHGVYCDEFAQFQFRDMPVRNMLGGFMPSTGVGTGFSRAAIEKLAAAYANRIFEPACLTEDYENGFRVHRLGCRQIFVPIARCAGSFVATREYFPREFRRAVKQRTRWAQGIALQSWEHHGSRETLGQAYWFWRDRKSIVNNLLTPLLHLMTLYGAVTLAWSWHAGTGWGLAREISRRMPSAMWAALVALEALHLAIRTGCSARIYGWKFALAAPLRVVWGNWINFLASASAIAIYFWAKARARPLVWLKTEHAYPNRGTLQEVAGLPAAESIEHLPRGMPEVIAEEVTRTFPRELARKWQVLPFKVAAGHLHVASAQPPTDAMHGELEGFSSLEIRFQLVSPEEFRALAEKYLEPAGVAGESEQR